MKLLPPRVRRRRLVSRDPGAHPPAATMLFPHDTLEFSAIQLLRKIEWHGTAKWWWNNWPKEDSGLRVAACPECGGVRPGVLATRMFPVVGHASNCELARIIGAAKGRP